MTAPLKKTREAIVEAARTLFARYGHGKTSVEEIAREAGLSKATVYNHFRGKEHIIAAVVERERSILLGKLRDAVAGAGGGLEALQAFFRTRVGEIQRLHRHYRMGREDFIRYMSIFSETVESSRDEERAIIAEVLERGVARGVFRPLRDLPLTADLLFSMLLSITFPLFGRPVGSTEARLEGFTEIVLNGICAGGDATPPGEEVA